MVDGQVKPEAALPGPVTVVERCTRTPHSSLRWRWKVQTLSGGVANGGPSYVLGKM